MTIDEKLEAAIAELDSGKCKIFHNIDELMNDLESD